MRVILLGLLLTASGCGFLSAQTTDPTPDRVLEGGRLLIDLIQTFKPKLQPIAVQGNSVTARAIGPDCPDGIIQICFQNDQDLAILVGVFARSNPDSLRSDLLIPSSQTACSYFYQSGVFIFEVQAQVHQDSILFQERGELLVRKCEQTTQVIQSN